MSTVYAVAGSEVAPFGTGTSYRVRAESTTRGCSHWYRASVSRRGSLVVTRLDDAAGTREARGFDGDAVEVPADDPIGRAVAEAVEREAGTTA